MKKIVRLTESDLIKIVKKVISKPLLYEEKIVTDFDKDYDYKEDGGKYFFKLKDTPKSSKAKSFKSQNKYVDWTEASGKGLEAIKSKVFKVSSSGSGTTDSSSSNVNKKTGCVKGNCVDGTGKFVYSNGDYYEGEWKSDVRNGKGKYVWTDGSYYEGDFIAGYFHGKGKKVFADGDYYEGDFKDDKFNGKGKYVDPSQYGYTYEGDFKDDKFNGKGKKTWYDGDYYEGDFKDDKFNGKGKLVYANGGYYEGDFMDGYRHGKGKRLKYTNGKLDYMYDGDYKEGFPHGYGQKVYYDASGKVDFLKIESGKFVEGKFVKK